MHIMILEDAAAQILRCGPDLVLTGVPASPEGFFARSIALFFGIYLVYFTVTYISFRRNVE